jgi:ketosteroid isomerase-like protein
MSRENVEIVRRAYEAFNRGSLDAVTAMVDPEIEFVPPPGLGESGQRGVESVLAMARQWIETFDDFRVDAERFIDPGGDCVVAFVRDRGRVKGTDVEIHNQFIHVWTLRGGKLVRWEGYTDETEALEAAGLSE